MPRAFVIHSTQLSPWHTLFMQEVVGAAASSCGHRSTLHAPFETPFVAQSKKSITYLKIHFLKNW